MTSHSVLRGLALTTMMVVVLFLVAACNDTTSPPTGSTTAVPSGSTPGAPAGSPTPTKPSGKINVAVDFHNGDIMMSAGKGFNYGNTFQAIGAPAFDSLIIPSPDGKPKPGLAEKWEIAPDGKTHTFYLKKGIKFQDGSDLTATDVKYTWEAMFEPGATSDAIVWKNSIEKVEVKDPYTIVLNFKAPQFELLVGFENFSGADAVVPQKAAESLGWDKFSRTLVGSGPYKVLSLSPSTKLELEALDTHWRKVPAIKNVTITNIKEEQTKVSMLKTGELDIAVVSPDSVAGLKAAGIKIVGHYGGGQVFSWPLYDVKNPKSSPMGDVRVRKAMSIAVDRKELADKVYQGYAQPGYLMFVPKTAYFFDPNTMKPDPFDPEGAKKLIADAGYGSGFSTSTYDVGGGGDISTITQALVGYWKKVGINSDLIAGDRTAILAKFQTVMQPEVFNKVWVYSSGGAIFNFERFYTPCHPTKGTVKNNANTQLGELIDKVPQTFNVADRTKTAAQAVLMCHDEYTTPAFLDVDTLYAVSSRVGNFVPTQGMLGLGYSYENMTLTK
ncbi:MAG: ABC transporter substrate-binding protein [Dehalococcoidia bacterium]|nr:ABC transporter substrate-binding protein [Dehalococcoidia bacterium]